MINNKNLDPNNIKIASIYYIGYVTRTNVKLFYQQSKGIYRGNNVIKYFTLVPTDESRDKLKEYEGICRKVKDIIILSINSNSDDYGEEYMKMKFNSDDDLIIKKQ